MNEPIVITSDDSVLRTLDFKAYRSKVERRVIPFVPSASEPQTMEISTPWGTQFLKGRNGDFLISEVDTPNDYWVVDPVIFSQSYVIVRPGYCVKRALTLLLPLTDLTGDDPDQLVTVVTKEGIQTVRAGDFWLAKGVMGEIWPYPKNMFDDVMMPAE